MHVPKHSMKYGVKFWGGTKQGLIKQAFPSSYGRYMIVEDIIIPLLPDAPGFNKK